MIQWTQDNPLDDCWVQRDWNRRPGPDNPRAFWKGVVFSTLFTAPVWMAVGYWIL